MKAVIIGGGIIGLCSAYYLHKSGWEITLLDKSDITDGCSYGNLGMIVPSHFIPLAAPGMVAQGIRWMFDKKSPFFIKPSFNPKLISWGLKFIKSASAKNVERSAPVLLNMNLYSKSLYSDLQKQPQFSFALEEKGILMYYKTEKVAEDELHNARAARDMGVDAVALNRNEVQQLEPQVKPDVLGAVHYRCDAHLYPNKLISQLINYLEASGALIKKNEPVRNVHVENGKITRVITSHKEYTGDMIIMAGGSWLPQLTRMAGLHIPLMPGKGYSFTYEGPTQNLNIPAILCEARVAITPMENQIRFGGTMEIAPVNDKINMSRVEGILESVPKYFPSMHPQMPEKKNIWYGFRPCSPDGLPYVGRPEKITNLIVAGGHAMMGLSLGPATGKAVADLANAQVPEVDISIFSPDRFG